MTSSELREQVSRTVGSYLDGGKAAGLVVGVIHGDRRGVFGFGQLARDDPSTPGDATIFEIGSITKVFTAILLADMAARGEVALDDPIRKHLPDSVHVPRYGEHEITLEHLATPTSGLPCLPANLNPKDMANPYADYSVEDPYKFLSEFRLTRDVGAAYEYSNVSVGLLGHILGLVAGRPFEDLVIERICRPLGMDDTRIVLDPGRAGRLAHGHDTGGIRSRTGTCQRSLAQGPCARPAEICSPSSPPILKARDPMSRARSGRRSRPVSSPGRGGTHHGRPCGDAMRWWRPWWP